jgi:NAD(P)H dehydrogenase (quinone)
MAKMCESEREGAYLRAKELTAKASDGRKRVAVIYYSTYGHVKTLADQIKAGAEAAGMQVDMFQVQETLSAEVLAKMGAKPNPHSDPVFTYAHVEKLPGYDGFFFGFPTRFGMMPAQMKAFFDQLGGLWVAGKLVGKPASMFTSTGTPGGGIETTIMTAVTQLTHHGMVFIPIGYSNPSLMNLKEIHAGSPWGASTYAGPDGSRQPSELELDLSEHQGKHAAGIMAKMCESER